MKQLSTVSLSFCGWPVVTEQLALIVRLAEDFCGFSCTEIANMACELLQWVRSTGKLKTMECRAFLASLQDLGLIRLQGCRPSRPCGSRTLTPITPLGEFGDPLEGALKNFPPLELEPLTSPAERWIGWSEVARRRNLQNIVTNSRFLILPWERIRNLAGSSPVPAARRLPDEWEACYKIRPVLLETLVDPARFSGTCYRAANWPEVGRTAGRGRQDRYHQRHGACPKMIFLYPLTADARSCLCEDVAP